MHRRKFIHYTTLGVGALTLFRNPAFAHLFEDPWKITMLNERLGIFVERGGTIAFLLSNDGIVVVDAQFPDQSKHLIDELKKKSTQPFTLLINTHHHGDHTAGNISFKGLAKHVLAHENSKINQENWAKKNASEDKQLYPDQTYGKTWREKFGRERVTLYYDGPAHTNGDSLVHFEHSNVVHCGDLVFNRKHPFIDRPAGANIKNWMLVLDTALNRFTKKTKYIFGHSGNDFPVGGKASDVEAFHNYLGNLLKFVGGEIKAGRTKEEILKAKVIPGSEEWKSDGIERPLLAAYEELTAAS